MTLNCPLSLSQSTIASFPGTNVPISAGRCSLPRAGQRSWPQAAHKLTVYLLDMPAWPGKVRPQALCRLSESKLGGGGIRSAVSGQRHPEQ